MWKSAAALLTLVAIILAVLAWSFSTAVAIQALLVGVLPVLLVALIAFLSQTVRNEVEKAWETFWVWLGRFGRIALPLLVSALLIVLIIFICGPAKTRTAGDAVRNWLIGLLSKPVLSVDYNPLQFGTNRDEFIIELHTKNENEEAIEWDAKPIYLKRKTDAISWITISPDSGTAQYTARERVTVTVHRDLLDCGVHEAVILFRPTNKKGKALRVSVIVDETPIPRVELTQDTVWYEREDPQVVDIKIYNDGAGNLLLNEGGILISSQDSPTLNWNDIIACQLTTRPEFQAEFGLIAISKAEPTRISLDIDWTNIPPSQNPRWIDIVVPLRFTTSSKTESRTLTARLGIIHRPAEWGISPNLLDFGTLAAADRLKTVQITNVGDGIMSLCVDWEDSASWIKSVRPRTNWAAGNGESVVFDVVATRGNLEPGTYEDHLVLADWSSRRVVVDVSAEVPFPKIGFDERVIEIREDEDLTFLQIHNTGGYHLDWTIDYTRTPVDSVEEFQTRDDVIWNPGPEPSAVSSKPRFEQSVPCPIIPRNGSIWSGQVSDVVILRAPHSAGPSAGLEVTGLRIRNLADDADWVYVLVDIKAREGSAGDDDAEATQDTE